MLKIEQLTETEDVYDITVENNSNFYANGILIHNCQEIAIPTIEMDNEGIVGRDDDELPTAEIGLCTLSSLNLGKITNIEDLESICDMAVRSLDALLSYQDYPVPAALHATKRRSLGIGVTNLAYYLAKNNLGYNKDSYDLIDRTFEAIQYYLLKSSNILAQEFGPCDYFNKTKYSDGILPIDTYKKSVDDLVNRELSYDWETLRQDILKHGLRNSTLTAQAPNESSSLVLNATNGIEPPKSPVTVKGTLTVVVPEYNKLKNKYTWLWDMENTHGYLGVCAIIQKYFDQSISVNTSYNPLKYSNENDSEIPLSVILKDILLAYKLGIKNLYYHQLNDLRDDENNSEIEEPGCEGGACAI